MKKVIDGALYNTETAKKIGAYSNGGSWRDFSHFEETLYRTKAGKYFLHGAGGPMTRYAESEGQNCWTGGERIEPMSVQAAREWAERCLDAEAYAAAFGEPEEAGDGKEALNLSVRSDIKAKLERMKQESGKSISAIIEQLAENL